MKRRLIIIIFIFILMYVVIYLWLFFGKHYWNETKFQSYFTIRNYSTQEILVYEQGEELEYGIGLDGKRLINGIFIKPNQKIGLCEYENPCFRNISIRKGEIILFEGGSLNTDWYSKSLGSGGYDTSFINIKTSLKSRENIIYFPFYFYNEKVAVNSFIVVK